MQPGRVTKRKTKKKMSEEAQDKGLAREFVNMAEYWDLRAAQTHNEWAAMKFQKKTKDGPGHTSKNKFDEYRRRVYGYHKYFRYRADICRGVAKHLETGEAVDLVKEAKPESAIKKAGKIITGNFRLPKNAQD